MNAMWNTITISHIEGDVKPFCDGRLLSEAGPSDVSYGDVSPEISPHESPRSYFDEEKYFGSSVLNLHGGSSILKIPFPESPDGFPSVGSPSRTVDEFLKFESNDLSGVDAFIEVDEEGLQLKPVHKTDQLVKLTEERMPFFESRKNLIIAQKPLDMNKVTGRLSFSPCQGGYINSGSNLKIFLRDIEGSTEEKLILDLKNIPKKNRCNCFDEHNKSLFCVRSKYEEAVKITWSEDKSFALIQVEDDTKFDILFAPLVVQSTLKKASSTNIMELVFQKEMEDEIFEQRYFVKFCSFPKRDIKHFIKNLVKENLVDDSYDEDKDKIIDESSGKRLYKLLRVEIREEDWPECKKFLKTIGGKVGEFK